MSADTAKWQSDMGKMVQETKSRTLEMSKAFEGVQGAVEKISGLMIGLAAGAGLKEFIKDSQAWNLESAKLAKTLGTNTEEASAFKSMLDHLGVSQDTVTGALLKLEKAAASNPEKFDKMGISIRDASGNLLPAEQILTNFNTRMNEFTEGAPRNAAASMVLGKGTKDLGDVLKATNTELENARERVEKLGLATTEDGVKKALAYKYGMNDLHEAFEAVSIKIGDRLVPQFVHFADGVVKFTEDNLPKFVEGLYSVEAELIRFAMLVDKVGGSFTQIQMLGAMPGAAMGIQKKGGFLATIFGSNEEYDDWDKKNKLYADRYAESEKELVKLGHLADGLDENGKPKKPPKKPAQGEGFNPDAMKTNLSSDKTASDAKYLEYEKAFYEAQAAIAKAASDLELERDKQSYDWGLMDYRTYLTEKQRLTAVALDAELEAKNKELDAANEAVKKAETTPIYKKQGKTKIEDTDAESAAISASWAAREKAQKAVTEANSKYQLEIEKSKNEFDVAVYNTTRGYQEQIAALADFQGDFVGAANIRKALDEDSIARRKLIADAMTGDSVAEKAYWAAEIQDMEKARQAAIAQKKTLDDLRLSTPDNYGNVNSYGQRQQSLSLAVGDINAKIGTNPEVAQLQQLEAQKTAIIGKSKAEQAAIQKRYDDEILSSQLDAGSKAAALLSSAAGQNIALQETALAIETGIAVARIMINTEVAKARALAELGPIAGEAMVGELTAMEGISIALTIGAGIVQGVNIAGKKADGGPVVAGQTYVVNENRATQGPEYFTPGVSGTITPANKMGGSTYAPVYQIDARNSTLSAAQIQGIVEQANQKSKNDMLNSLGRGGEFAVAVKRAAK
jgi:hypothetical protein